MKTNELDGRAPEVEPEQRKLPPPVPDGTTHFESLGTLLDNLMGDARRHRKSDRELASLWGREDDAPDDPPPTDLPEPVPDGPEPLTKGDEPDAEKR
jgi:hypothetical protein